MAAVRARCIRLWRATEVSHSGEFSPQRLQAFEDYASRTSWLRACSVCVFTPLPALLFVIAIEAALPLAPPNAPLQDQLNINIRTGTCALSVAFASISMAREFVPSIPLPRLAILRAATLCGTLYPLTVVAYTLAWNRFPVPFIMPQTIPFFWSCLVVSCRIFLLRGFKAAAPDQIQHWQQAVKHYATLLAWVGLLQVVYPAYGALFASLKGSIQVFVVVLPSLAKRFMKAKLAALCRANVADLEEAIPQLVNFTVELFHALYVTNCMQTTTTPLRTTVVVIVMDFVPNFFAVRRLLQHISQPRAPTGEQVLRLDSVLPAPLNEQPGSHAIKPMINGEDCDRHGRRRLLFACEYHVLVEYIECVIPLTYAIYIAVLYQLPNAVYYPHMQRLKVHATADSPQAPLATAISYIMLFVALEFISLATFSILIRSRLGISCVKLLAFTLETQAEMVQMKLFTWMPYCIFLPVVHGGVDFTLKFDWSSHPPS